MKKFIIAIGAVLLLTVSSCQNLSSNIIYPKGLEDRTKKIEYSGHSYIVFSDGYSFDVVHDPDCECMIDYD